MPNHQDLLNRIQALLQEKLETHDVHCADESHLHASHASYNANKIHLVVRATSPIFQDLSLLERQRLVYKILADEMQQNIHALRFERLTSPDKAQP